MTPKAAMVLTGKRALEYSGSVSAEDNEGIGGYDRIMGPNGQAQYWARNIDEACQILLRHYEHAYVAPGERFPRKGRPAIPSSAMSALSAFPRRRGICPSGRHLLRRDQPRTQEVVRHSQGDARRDGPGLSAVGTLVRHAAAETGVVWMRISALSVLHDWHRISPIAAVGFVPADGPDQWTAGTLFPLSSKKVAVPSTRP